MAVRKGDTEAAKALLAAGANPNQAMPWVPHETQGHSPLVRAAGDGNLSMVQLLLAHGAEVNAPDSAGRTALLAACARPSGIFWTDLRERLGLDRENEESTGIGRFMLGKSPLEEAEPVGDWSEIIELLLSKGADMNAETPASSPHAVIIEVCGTPLLKAAQRGDAALIARLLASGASPRPTCGTTPLHAALFQPAGSSTEAVERLLNAGTSITERDSDGSSPAGCAIRTGNLTGLKLLIGAGLDLQTRNPEFGTTLLHAAAQSGHVEIAQYLLDSGLELDATGTAPSPAERQAERDKIRSQVEQGREEAGVDRGLPELPVHLLQAPQGEPDTERATGITPLMLAAGANKADMVRLLLERGADPNRRDSKGKTARDYALRTEATEQRQRAFLNASQFNVLESPQLKDTMEKLPDDSFRSDLAKQLEEMQSNFSAVMEKMLSGKRDAREETLALLPE